jgi:hypothetical protein
MKIETKYDIGQEVWVMKDNSPQKFKVNGISVECLDGMYNSCRHLGLTAVNYDLGTRMSPLIYTECYLYPTKEELIKSL